MTRTVVALSAPGGVCQANLFEPDGGGAAAGLLFYTDALGPRDASLRMAEAFCARGHVVLVPDLYYRDAPYAPLHFETIQADPAESARIARMMASVDDAKAQEDVAVYAAFLAAHDRVTGPLDAVGYCMGGRFSLLSAGCGDLVGAVASIHGAFLATDRDDSPHRALRKGGARAYLGVAGIDAYFTDAELARIASDWRSAEVDFTIANNAGTHHGYTVSDLPSYDPAAAARQMDALATFFGPPDRA